MALKKKTVWILFLSLGVLLAAYFTTEYYLNRKLNRVLRHDLVYQLGYAYTIDFSTAKVRLFQNDVKINNLIFSRGNSDDIDWVFTAGKVEFNGFRPVDFLLGKGFGVDSIQLLEPHIDMKRFVFSDRLPDSTSSAAHRDTGNKIDSVQISIGKIRCKNGILNYNPQGPEKLNCNFDFTLRDIHFDQQITNIEALWQKSSVYIQDVTYQFPDSIYIATVEEISLPDFSQNIGIQNFTLTSTLSRSQFPQYFGWKKSRLEVAVPRMSIAPPKDFGDSLLVISAIETDSIYFEIHKDSRYPLPVRITKLPQGPVANLPFPVRIDSVKFKNSVLKYIGVFENQNTLEVYFNDVVGSLAGFQNIDLNGDVFHFHASAKFMGESDFSMQTRYSYGAHDPFTLQASLGEANIGFMNVFLQKAAGIKITECDVSGLDLKMNGNVFGETGYVDLFYSDLKIQAVDKDSGEKKWLKNIFTDLAKGFLIRKENEPGDKFKRGEFSKERTVEKGFPSQWVEGLFEGMLQSVAKVDPAKVKREKKQN